MLQDRGIEPKVVEYLKTPPNAETLKSILGKLGMEPRALMRRKESPYKDFNLDDPALDVEALVASMVKNPILIERPILVANGKAALGRPPEKVLEIL